MLRLNRLSRINIVTTTKQGRTPGRPRQFDAEQAIETAQRLFHARGYDAVSVADLTQAFGINPPSFYAAFGNRGKSRKRRCHKALRRFALPRSGYRHGTPKCRALPVEPHPDIQFLP